MRREEGGYRKGARVLEVAILIALPILLHYLIPVVYVISVTYVFPPVRTWGGLEACEKDYMNGQTKILVSKNLVCAGKPGWGFAGLSG
jgi:hypothetical protein